MVLSVYEARRSGGRRDPWREEGGQSLQWPGTSPGCWAELRGMADHGVLDGNQC